jgi:signal transduction histidine kinase
MGSPLERRHTHGRRRSDDRDTRALRGLLHDLGHEMTTLSYLVEAVRGDVALPDDSSNRLELLSLEMSRLLSIIRQGLPGVDGPASPEPVEVRQMLAELARLAQLTYEADVRLLPGHPTSAFVNPVLLWRVLSNVADNAARAAGPGGRVMLAAHQDVKTVIEITDDGPGFGAGPPGTASLGLEVVTSLLESFGGSLAVESPPAGGTTVRVLLPREVAAVASAGASLGE